MRYIQHPITFKLIPADEYERPKERGHFVQGDVQSFVSPVDGSVITDRKQLREHNRKNDVVSADEFSPEFYARKQKERDRTYTGERTRQETFERKREIYQTITDAERA